MAYARLLPIGLRELMSEPAYLFGDDVALGINQTCDNCDEIDCICFEPDRMWEDDD
jgi:hypothetical protein